MTRIPRKLAGIGASDIPNATAFDAYIGPSREVTVDPARAIIALHDGVTPGGHRFASASQGGLADTALQPDDIGETVAAYSDPRFTFKQSGTGSVSRSFEAKGRDIIDARDFLASDGSDLNNPSVNVGSKLTAALRVLRDRGGGKLVIPDGIIYASNIRLFSKCVIEGQSKIGSKLKAPSGTTTDVILGTDNNEVASAYEYFDQTIYDLAKGCNQAGIRNLTIDGNFAGGAVACPFVAWGYGLIVEDVYLRDSGRDGMRTEWTDGSVSMEGTFNNIVIDTAQWHGWRNKGPHDAHVANTIIIDASQASDRGYNGLYSVGTNGRYFNLHVWCRSSTTLARPQYAVSSAGGSEFVASHFEGCRRQLLHAGNADRVIGCLIYAPFGSSGDSLVYMAGGENQHIGNRYMCGSVAPTQPNTYAIQMGTSGVAASGNMIVDGYFAGFYWGTPFNFVNSSGLNVIRGRGWAAAGGAVAFAGIPHSLDEIDYVQAGTAINYRKPAAFGAYADNAAAAAGGVPVGGLYKNSTTNVLTVRTT